MSAFVIFIHLLQNQRLYLKYDNAYYMFLEVLLVVVVVEVGRSWSQHLAKIHCFQLPLHLTLSKHIVIMSVVLDNVVTYSCRLSGWYLVPTSAWSCDRKCLSENNLFFHSFVNLAKRSPTVLEILEGDMQMVNDDNQWSTTNFSSPSVFVQH